MHTMIMCTTARYNTPILMAMYLMYSIVGVVAVRNGIAYCRAVLALRRGNLEAVRLYGARRFERDPDLIRMLTLVLEAHTELGTDKQDSAKAAEHLRLSMAIGRSSQLLTRGTLGGGMEGAGDLCY